MNVPLLENNYFEYFSIPLWLVDQVRKTQEKTTNAKKTPQIKTHCLIIENQHKPHQQCFQKDNNTKQYQLLLKMLAAIDLIPEMTVFETTDGVNINKILAKYQAKTILLLDTISIDSHSAQAFYCPHPEDILQNTELKKQAWASLKQLKLAL